MNNNIDDKAKDEVRELLNELVVSPISGEFDEKIAKVTESLLKLEKVSNEFNIIESLIRNESSKLSNFHVKLDEVSSTIGAIELNCKNIKEKAGKFDDIQLKVNESLSVIKDSINETKAIKEAIQNEEKTLSKVDNKLQDVSSQIKACQTVCEEMKQQLLEKVQTCCIEINGANGKLDELRATLSIFVEQVGNIEKDMSKQLQGITQNIDYRVRTLNDSLGSISTSLEKKNSEVSEEHKRQFKHNKYLFLIVIVLSVINMLGLILIHVFH